MMASEEKVKLFPTPKNIEEIIDYANNCDNPGEVLMGITMFENYIRDKFTLIEK
jgi:hypothetical protein